MSKLFFAYDGSTAEVSCFATEQEALDWARSCIDEDGGEDGWQDSTLETIVGVITHQAVEVNKRPDPTTEFDFLCEVELRPIGAGEEEPAPHHGDGSVPPEES